MMEHWSGLIHVLKEEKWSKQDLSWAYLNYVAITGKRKNMWPCFLSERNNGVKHKILPTHKKKKSLK